MAEEELSQTTIPGKRRILIGIDGSEHSERAFNFYLGRICESGDHVVLLHAMEVPSLPPAPYPYGFAFYEEWQKVQLEAVEEAKRLLRHFGDILKTRPDITFKMIKEGGKGAGELICKNIIEEDATMAVMGSRGQSTVRRTFLGSCSDYVVHHSHVPLCIVPPEI